MVRRPATRERESWLFHHQEGTVREQGERLIANPFGFAEWFNGNTPRDHDFAQLYEARSREYERMILEGSAQDDPVPPQELPGQKSKAVIVLQLMKRWRNVRYDRRPGRRPPSILLSNFVADNAGRTDTLSHELLHQARQLLSDVRGVAGGRQVNFQGEPRVFGRPADRPLATLKRGAVAVCLRFAGTGQGC